MSQLDRVVFYLAKWNLYAGERSKEFKPKGTMRITE